MYLLIAEVYVVAFLLSGLGFYFLAPQEYLQFVPIVGGFYFFTGMVYNYMLDRCRYQPEKLVSVFMIARMVKFLLTIAFLVFCVKGLKFEATPFAITLMCNFFLYTALELYLYYRYSTWHSKRATIRNEKDS